MQYLESFIYGGLICVIAQILIDKTKIMPARILVGLVVGGAILSAIGIYEKFVNIAGSGATIPIIGFGHCLVQGVKKSLNKDGPVGIFFGGLTNVAAGVSACVFFALIMSIFFSPKEKN